MLNNLFKHEICYGGIASPRNILRQSVPEIITLIFQKIRLSEHDMNLIFVPVYFFIVAGPNYGITQRVGFGRSVSTREVFFETLSYLYVCHERV